MGVVKSGICIITVWRPCNSFVPFWNRSITSFEGCWVKRVRSLSSLNCMERKEEFWRSAFKTWTSNIIEWMLSLWVRFWVQYSLLLQYGILEKPVTHIVVFTVKGGSTHSPRGSYLVCFFMLLLTNFNSLKNNIK